MAEYDLVIIGGGPVGLFGATLARLHGLSVKIIESLPELGGQLYALYPEKPIYDVAGFPSILAKDLAQALIKQAERFQPDVATGAPVETLEALAGDPPRYRVSTKHGSDVARAVLITVGVGAFVPRRLPAEGAENFEERGVYYFVPPLATFKNQRVVVVGGGDTAVDWTLAIAEHADEVAIVHRRHQFRAQEESLRMLREKPNVRVFTPHELVAVEGDDAIQRVVLKHVENGEHTPYPVDSVVGGLGFLPTLGPVKNWGLELEGNTIVVDPTTLGTNLPGVFAAGDVVTYPGKVKLIATGFGEIGTAIARIRHFIDPSKHGLPHSTNIKGIPTA
ncbi:MAG: NAD(P)/FAD-dependent oxidoreductase [Sulfobacillus sp.]|nr:NAD(P)/FAD-dependent oxidoreductase [Sulfobacillus sp.]